MPRDLYRPHESGQGHFVTFSCYRLQPFFNIARIMVRDTHACVFLGVLERGVFCGWLTLVVRAKALPQTV